LLGHGGPNSLLSFLKSEGLVMSITAKEDNYISVFSLIQLKLKLTKKGLDSNNEVLAAVFAYAQLLKDAGPQESVFEDCKNIG
jgi:secreted Zn-dependent insulinase-like peptidase